MEIDNNDNEDDASLRLLTKAQAMVDIEQSLTATLEKVEPWLLSATTTSIDPNRPRVRPIPQTMDQVHKILAVARNLASRTSAPPEWNPAAPVVGFSTPNPLPHQLRGGALATLQLERARQAERDRQRQRRVAEEEQERTHQKKTAAAATAAAKNNNNNTNAGGGGGGGGPGHHHLPSHPDPQHRAAAERRAAREAHARRANNPEQQQQLLAATMNLSDSSSSDDDDEEDSD